MFCDDVPDLRIALEECDECAHIHSYKQEWHVLLEKKMNIKIKSMKMSHLGLL